MPLFLIVAVPAFDVLKKPTTALGFAAPEPLLLMVEPPAVELSKKLMSPVAFVLFSVAVPAVEVSKNSVLLPLPLSVMVEVPAVVVSLNRVKLLTPLLFLGYETLSRSAGYLFDWMEGARFSTVDPDTVLPRSPIEFGGGTSGGGGAGGSW